MEARVKELLFGQGKTSGTFDEQLATSCRQFFTERVEFRAARQPDTYLAYLKATYKPLNVAGDKMEAMDTDTPAISSPDAAKGGVSAADDGFPRPKYVIFNPDKVEIAWKHVRGVGSGLCNMGNTCFLNSVLQCLSHTPPLYNYVTSEEHKQTCE